MLPSVLLVVAGALYASTFVNLNTLRAAAGPLQGRASVVDGDTVEIAGQRVRFNGIDAPTAMTNALARFTPNITVWLCDPSDEDHVDLNKCKQTDFPDTKR
jgi:hypothetical protein